MWWQVRRLDAMEREASAKAVSANAAELQVRSADVAFYEARAERDPESATDRAHLAALYMQRGRETSDERDYLRAEHTARASLALRTQRNGEASVVLAASLLAQHRFVEARDVARTLVDREPTVDAYRALLGETHLELGEYDDARTAFASISPGGRHALAVAPRLARWAEIRGDTVAAREILRAAVEAADKDSDLPREQAAWFHLRLADMYLRQGHERGAERELRDGLAISPADHRLLAARARFAAVRHEWRNAIAYGDSATAVVLDPATLGVESDAYAALGDTARATEYAAAMEVAAGQQARHLSPRVEPVPARPRAARPGSAGGGAGRAHRTPRHQRVRSTRVGVVQEWPCARSASRQWPRRSHRAPRTRCSSTTRG